MSYTLEDPKISLAGSITFPEPELTELRKIAYLLFSVSCSVMSNSLWLHGQYPKRLLCPWYSPGKHTGVGSHSFLHRIFLNHQFIIKGCDKDRNIQMEEMHRGSYIGKGMKAPCPPPEVHLSPRKSICLQTWSSLTTTYLGAFYGGFFRPPYWSLTPFLASTLSLENGRWSLKVQASNHGLVFLVASTYPGTHKIHLIRTKNTATTQDIPRDLGTVC